MTSLDKLYKESLRYLSSDLVPDDEFYNWLDEQGVVGGQESLEHLTQFLEENPQFKDYGSDLASRWFGDRRN